MNALERVGSVTPDSEGRPDVMQVPEVGSEIEWGAQLFSLLMWNERGRGEDETDGETVVKALVGYLNRHPVDASVVSRIREIRDLGGDDESLHALALAYGRSDRTEEVVRFMRKHKSDASDPDAIAKKLHGVLGTFDSAFTGTPEADMLMDFLSRDRRDRMLGAKEAERRLAGLIRYFRPDTRTVRIRAVNFIPTDPFVRKDTGSMFLFGDELVIASHIGNIHNQDHEFLHGILNPIADTLADVLSQEEKERISSLASEALKNDYGDDWSSLLCEELIRTYKEVVEVGSQEIRDYDGFMQVLSSLDEAGFIAKRAENRGLRDRCAELGIETLDDLRARASDYFERFVLSNNNPLRELVTALYREYSERPDREKNFESFILETLPNRLSGI